MRLLARWSVGLLAVALEYACAGPVQGGGFGYGIFQGPADAGSVRALQSWHLNAVALPLNEACWVGGYAHLNPRYSGKPYRQAIVSYVRRLAAAGIYVVLRLSGAAPGDHAYGSDQISSDEVPMADADHRLDPSVLPGLDVGHGPGLRGLLERAP